MQTLRQLGLADEHDLHELPRVGLEVGEQPQLLEGLVGEVLRLVDDERGVAPRVGLAPQVVVERLRRARLLVASVGTPRSRRAEAMRSSKLCAE
jgi:hypothetical protein